MALFHAATVTPTKAETIEVWLAEVPWGSAPGEDVDVIGSYRFDDPEGEVGLESFLVRAGDRLIHVPLTYRGSPLEGGEDALVTEMEHTTLGTRWVYDGLRDPRYVVVLAGVTMTGQGEALGMAHHEGQWWIAPATIRIDGGGWTTERTMIDGFELQPGEGAKAVLRSDRFELAFHRHPVIGPRPPIALTATWAGQDDAVVLAEIREVA